jgi:hypothetical protein
MSNKKYTTVYTVQYSPSDFLLLKHLWTHISFLLLRAAFAFYSSNVSVIVANYLLQNEWRCTFDDNNHKHPKLSRAVPERGWTRRTVWTQTILKESDGTETSGIAWIGPNTYCIFVRDFTASSGLVLSLCSGSAVRSECPFFWIIAIICEFFRLHCCSSAWINA